MVIDVKTALQGQGFEVVGAYSPYPNATVIVVTSGDLKAKAAKSDFGGYGAIERVAVTKVKDKIQVSYTNPPYWAAAYRMTDNLADVKARLESALGKKGIRFQGRSYGKGTAQQTPHRDGEVRQSR